MFLYCIFIAIPLATLAYFAWMVGWHKPVAYAVAMAPGNHPTGGYGWKPAQQSRAINWISFHELESRTRPFEDVIVVNLLQNEFPTLRRADYVFIRCEEFCDVLRWLPSSSCVVLYGPSELCRAMVKSAQGVTGHAPIFVVPAIPGF
jgi:hypothetical protein